MDHTRRCRGRVAHFRLHVPTCRGGPDPHTQHGQVPRAQLQASDGGRLCERVLGLTSWYRWRFLVLCSWPGARRFDPCQGGDVRVLRNVRRRLGVEPRWEAPRLLLVPFHRSFISSLLVLMRPKTAAMMKKSQPRALAAVITRVAGLRD